MKIKRGSTSVRRLIFVADSSSTTGAGLANLVYNTASLVAYYFAGDLSNEVQITLATATLGTFASGGFVAVDNTNMPGWYEIGIPDAALDGGIECAIQFRGAANMVPVNVYIELDAFDYQTATQPVNVTQFGGANLTATAGIPSVNTTQVSGTAQTAGDIYASQVAIAGYIDTEVSAIKAKTDNLPSDPADQSAVESAITAATSPLATQASVNTIDDFLDTEIAAIKTKTDQLTFTTANKVDSTAVLDSAVGTQINNIENAAGWLLAINSGACANPQTASEQYDITAFGVAFRVVMAGQTSTGTRTAPTLSKP